MRKIQAGYKVQTLSAFLGTAPPPPPPAGEWLKPMPPADERTSPEFFNQLAFLLQFALPAHPSETELRERFATIGIKPGKPFELAALSTDEKNALIEGMAEGQRGIDARAPRSAARPTSVWRPRLSEERLRRASDGYQVGIGANWREEAIYRILERTRMVDPFDGRLMVPSLKFAKGSLPPVECLLVMTIYNRRSSCWSRTLSIAI